MASKLEPLPDNNTATFPFFFIDLSITKNAEGGTRTPTGLLPQVPETCVSANSTTSASSKYVRRRTAGYNYN